MTFKPKIVVIVGPTASGKSDLAVALAKQFNGEVVSADSRQVYRGMNIGTGKITRSEMHGVPHHLLDTTSPKDVFTAADYQRDATRALSEILQRKKLPIICGGTGFYIQAIVDGLTLPDVKANPLLRKQLSKKSIAQLFVILKKLDPKRSETIDAKNPRRLIRAIEIAHALGKVPAIKKHSSYKILCIGLAVSTETLRARIHKRLEKRMRAGMLHEVNMLHQKGVSWKRMEELGLEYRFCARYLRGTIDKKTLLAELESAIDHYAKRQMTWFKKDKRIHWIKLNDKKIGRLVKKFLG